MQVHSNDDDLIDIDAVRALVINVLALKACIRDFPEVRRTLLRARSRIRRQRRALENVLKHSMTAGERHIAEAHIRSCLMTESAISVALGEESNTPH